MGSYLSIITLNINGLNAPTKRQRLAEWIQKQDSYICCLQETHLKPRDTYRLKVKDWKKIFHNTTHMAEGEEELKSLLMKVKVESEKVGLKLNVQKMKIMASGPSTSW